MPFKSLAQQRYMYAKHPKIAKRWGKVTDFSKLPEKAKPMDKVGDYFKGKKK